MSRRRKTSIAGTFECSASTKPIYSGPCRNSSVVSMTRFLDDIPSRISSKLYPSCASTVCTHGGGDGDGGGGGDREGYSYGGGDGDGDGIAMVMVMKMEIGKGIFMAMAMAMAMTMAMEMWTSIIMGMAIEIGRE